MIPTFGDMIIAMRDTRTTAELSKVWTMMGPFRPELPDNDRIRLMEHALARFMAIEARHEGDGK